jgi:hypothetical protein
MRSSSTDEVPNHWKVWTGSGPDLSRTAAREVVDALISIYGIEPDRVMRLDLVE